MSRDRDSHGIDWMFSQNASVSSSILTSRMDVMEKDVKDDIDDEVMTDRHYFMYCISVVRLSCVFFGHLGAAKPNSLLSP